MNRLNSWQQKQHTAKIKYHPSWLIASIATVLAPCYVLLTSIESYANLTGKIVELGGLVTLTRGGTEYTTGLRGMPLGARRDGVQVQGRYDAWVNLKIGNTDFTGGPDAYPFWYSFPCEVSNRWTVGIKGECQKGIILKESAITSSQLPRNKQSRVDANYIMIVRASNQETVIQTDESNDGSQLTVDVLAGTVTIRSRLKPGGINLIKGQRYTYSVNGRGDSIGDYDPDWDTVRDIFLNPNNWEPSDANQIEAYRNAINPPQVAPQ